MRRVPLAALAAGVLALALPGLGSAAIKVDVPAALERQITLTAPRTGVPIRLPNRIDAEREVFPQIITAVKRRWTMDLAYAPNCRQATACFFASFSGRVGKIQAGQRVALAKGKVGRFAPRRCGASCTPPRIEWRQGGFVYGISANALSPGERFRLVNMANQSVVTRPRG